MAIGRHIYDRSRHIILLRVALLLTSEQVHGTYVHTHARGRVFEDRVRVEDGVAHDRVSSRVFHLHVHLELHLNALLLLLLIHEVDVRRLRQLELDLEVCSVSPDQIFSRSL